MKEGEVFSTKEGCSVVVISYQNSCNVLVEFLDENKHRATVPAGNLRTGRVKNPFYPSMLGVGHFGAGPHKAGIVGKFTPAYVAWKGIIRRCYSASFHTKCPTYIGCSVSPEWLNFQSFAAWHKKEPNSEGLGFDLDKDLRRGGNKVYSPEDCSFVPQQINKLLCDSCASRGSLPQGVKANGKGFSARLRVKSKYLHLGTYATPELAFEVYKKAKEANVRSMAEEWRDYLHPEVYAYLKAWTLL